MRSGATSVQAHVLLAYLRSALFRDMSVSETELLGAHPLLVAAKMGWLRWGSCWSTKAANFSTSAEGLTALMVAAEAKNLAVVQWLHEGKADPSQVRGERLMRFDGADVRCVWG